MNNTFYNKYATDFRAALTAVGLSYRFLPDNTHGVLQDIGFSIVEAHSILDLSLRAGLFSIPKLVRNLFLTKLAEGYTLYILSPRI
jgi:hypothetical protein